ncbi:MAG: hypothetical protein V3T63_00020 [Nitrosopumilaceae archaeon]
MSKGPTDLTLAERLEYAIRHLDFWYRISLVIVLIGLASLSGIVSVSQYYFHSEIAMYGHIAQIYNEDENITVLEFIPNSEVIFPAEGIVNLFSTQVWLMGGNGIVIGLLTFLFLWVTKRGNDHKKEFESIEGQFIRQTYLVNFETSIPEGQNKVEKILNQAIHVFPTLKDVQRKSKEKQTKIPYKIDQHVNGLALDAVVATNKGEFIVKFYEKTVSFSDIQELVNTLIKSRDRIFRVLCVAKDYDEEIQSNKLVDIMDKMPKYFKLDLIFEEENGYSMLWID